MVGVVDAPLTLEIAKGEESVGEGGTPEGSGDLGGEVWEGADVGGQAWFALGAKLDWAGKAVDVGDGMKVGY